MVLGPRGKERQKGGHPPLAGLENKSKLKKVETKLNINTKISK
jgi:hypothetical protein